MKKFPYSFVAREADELHCFQAAFRMTWEALTCEQLSLARGDALTGFRDGMQTWPFAGMLAFASRGLRVCNIEDFRADDFARDPVAEIRRQIQDPDVAQFVIDESDLEQERRRVEDCIASENVSFVERVPEMADLRKALYSPATMVIVNVNYRALNGADGYYGHFVLPVAAVDGYVAFQDPGPPPSPAARVSEEVFVKAWRSADGNAANLLVVSSTVSATDG